MKVGIPCSYTSLIVDLIQLRMSTPLLVSSSLPSQSLRYKKKWIIDPTRLIYLYLISFNYCWSNYPQVFMFLVQWLLSWRQLPYCLHLIIQRLLEYFIESTTGKRGTNASTDAQCHESVPGKRSDEIVQIRLCDHRGWRS